MAGASFDLAADISDYVKEVAKIPGITDAEAQKAGKAIRQRLVNEAVKGLVEVRKEAKDTVQEVGKVGDKANKELGNQILDLGELVGVPGDGIKKLVSGLGALANPAGVAAVAVGAIAAATVGVAAGITSAVAAADDFARELEDIRGLTDQEGFGVNREQLKTIDEANAAMQALSVIGKQAVVTLGAEFAPTVKTVAVELVKLGLVGLDAFNAFAEGNDILTEVASFMAGRLVKSITAPVDALTELTETLAKVAEIAGQDGLAKDLHSVDAAYEQWVDSLADGAVDLLGDEIERVTELTGDYDARAEQLVGTLVKQAEAERNAAENAKAKAEAEREAEKAEREREAAIRRLTGEVEKLADINEKASETREERLARELADLDALQAQLAEYGQLTLDNEVAIIEGKKRLQDEYLEEAIRVAIEAGNKQREIDEAEAERIEANKQARINAAWTATSQGLAAAQQLADLGYDIATESAQAAADALEDTDSQLTAFKRQQLEARQKQEEKAAKRFFALSKALSLVQITVATAEGVQSAIAAGMKLGGPVAAALLAAGVVASGVAQAAVVAKQKPPSAHRGRVPLTGGAADEQLTTVLANEAVLTATGVDSAGGPEGVAAMNAGQSSGMGGSVMVNLNLNNRTMQTVVAEASRGPGPARNAMRRDNPVGQRRRR